MSPVYANSRGLFKIGAPHEGLEVCSKPPPVSALFGQRPLGHGCPSCALVCEWASHIETGASLHSASD